MFGVDGDEDRPRERAGQQFDEVGDVCGQHGVRVALVFAGAGAEPEDVDAFPGAQWSVPGDVVEHGAHDRVAVLQHRAAGAQHVVGETGDAVADAHHAEEVGLLAEPGPGKLGAGRSFEPFDDRAHRVMVVRAGRDDRRGAPRPQRGDRAGEGAVSQQEEHLLRVQLPVGAGGGAQAGHGVGVDDPVIGAVPLGGAAFELGVEHVAGQVVGEQPARAAGDERASGQPLPHRGGVGADQIRKEVLGGQPGDRAGGQAGQVGLAGHLAQERLQQRRDEIRCVGEGVGHLTGGGEVGQQGHGQRVPAAERHQMRPERPVPRRRGRAAPRFRPGRNGSR